MWLSRLLGRGKGSSLPGMIALKIFPGILDALAGQTRRGIIMVTGTNGKTTTNNMIAGMVGSAGYGVVANLQGANLISGVTTAFIEKASWRGKVDCDYACLEVDEASFPAVSRKAPPRLVVVTNFFRDQLDRYGELDKTVKFVQDALCQLPESQLALNADDPLVAQLQVITGLPALFYGLGGNAGFPETEKFSVREARFCPLCGKELFYEYYYYGQLGNFRCSQCGFVRPESSVQAGEIVVTDSGISCRVGYGKDNILLELPLRGLYNLYNALAACSAGLLAGIEAAKISRFLRTYTPATGRMEHFRCHGKNIVLNLVKNPTGFNESLSLLLATKEYLDVLIAINDNPADGRDISWLWDVDFEVLEKNHRRLNIFVCSGSRAGEMGVRLKYAGVPLEKIVVEPHLKSAVERILDGAGQAAYLMTTYTALWPVEKELRKYVDK
jgi:UDP-N-acetylmuramyl tripeptide synthase